MAKQQRFDPQAVDRARGSARPKTTGPATKTPGRNASSKGRGKSGRPGGRPPAEASPATLGTWISAARPATLALALAPVALGTGAAALLMPVWYDHWVRALLCLAVAALLQIGVNYANDYSDGIRGTDAHRVGPARLVGSGRAKPRHVLVVALVFFGLAAVAGLALVVLTQHWWLLAVGAVAIVVAWFYTGGRRPYGYTAGLAELAVFVFFGLAAVAGTTFVQVGTVNLESWLGGVAAGLFAVAVLHVNNLRDRVQDRAAGKRTLAVRLGDMPSRVVYALLVAAPFGLLAFYAVFYDLAAYVYFALFAAAPAILIVITARTAREFVTALKLTLLSALAYEVGLAAALALVVQAGVGAST
ncbi:1,4-dihydroxy-2-naphthoate polyprenyltransferase [Protaetiibacter mangrovi]|uniref:1,4-dihydroxy-2-naphthoate octaprenyltransferase n=2 Tax=Microbacteriaceae TaxID=85023 RepID=A0ABT1ZGB2_9MICO|nr:1,4-dihydroxy-2-naphthoate polyprenyltransferase [Protaetiibacter mangrovi]MCS0499730.1 1,4-dihydroxy-2-naphthoate polyprenyltransferase [Protaetiibacter mangrovi]TPX03534.1 1,4-dihydroxy-2-naphthoate polyprenyltransferase [Schumannella luteola]